MKDLFPLIKYLKRYKVKLFIGFIFIVISISLQAVYPLVIGSGIQSITTGKPEYPLYYYALTSIILILLGGFFLFLVRQNIIVVSREIENDLRNDFFSHLQTLDRTFYNTHTTGDIMAHATNDINNIRNMLGPGIMYSIQTFLRTAVTLAIMFSISSYVTLIALIPLPLISLLVYKVMKLTYSRSMNVQKSFSDMSTKAQENFSGIRVIKSYVREENELKDFTKISNDYQKKNLKLARMQSYSFPMMFLLTGLSVILVIYFGGISVMKGEFTVGNIAEFVMYLGMLTFPMIALGWIINLVQRAAPSMKRLSGIMETKPLVADSEETDNTILSEKIEGEIEFKNVSFKYPDTNIIILKNLSIKIKKGSTIGIIGYTGVGKSTLISLIPRVYDVTEGEILIDGYDIKKIPLEILRKSIGIVPQESFLFSDNLANNIAYSSDNLSEELITSSSKIAGLYKDIIGFPEGFKTIIGERGISLSGGQKQRTSIARALYMNPKILILDDSLSAVDTKTEEEILKGLKDAMKERTSIIIAHRISTIKNADTIIVLNKAEIAEQGSHYELIEKGGIYYDIYQKQLLEEEIEEAD
jgi:ATP-binding cassette subfamily B protein